MTDPIPEVLEWDNRGHAIDSKGNHHFDHIPGPREILGDPGIIPGMSYANVTSIGLGEIQNDAGPHGYPWVSYPGGEVYFVHGTTGRTGCHFMQSGAPIKGANAGSWTPPCFTDRRVYELTGHLPDNEGEVLSSSTESEDRGGVPSAGAEVPSLTPPAEA